MLPRFKSVLASVLLLALWGGTQAAATEMVYTPINPSFGGNPNNAPGLMSIAQAQNGFKAPVFKAPVSPVQAFNLSLQRAILSRLTSQTMTAIFGTSPTLEDGTYDTPGYIIKVAYVPDTSQVTITTTDKSSGAVASFEVATP